MQIRHIHFACIERDEYASMLQVDFYVVPPAMFFNSGRSLRTHSLQSSPSVAISIVSQMP